jgi:acetyltransferase
MPPPGPISIVSQSGNLISSLMNYSCATGVGVARGISAGNASALSVADYLRWLGGDAATAVAVAYVEHAGRGRELFEAVRELAAAKPVVILKGGATAAGQAAAASHTGALASEDRLLDGALRQAGACRVATIEAAFELAATFATQPLPRGPNTAVVTAAGGWGVLAADALARSTLSLVPLPADLRRRIDGLLPPRWSGANPIDLAGGETRDTIPALLDLVASHPSVDAVVYLGLGIQSNTARMLRAGPFAGDDGLARVVAFHERQDRRFATAAAEVSAATGKPVLVASELAFADPANPGPATVRESGRLCYPSAERAVAALEASRWYAAFRERRSLPTLAG